MDGQLWAKRRASKCLRGPRENWGRKFILTDFKIGKFDFDPSEVENATSTEVFDTQTLG